MHAIFLLYLWILYVAINKSYIILWSPAVSFLWLVFNGFSVHMTNWLSIYCYSFPLQVFFPSEAFFNHSLCHSLQAARREGKKAQPDNVRMWEIGGQAGKMRGRIAVRESRHVRSCDRTGKRSTEDTSFQEATLICFHVTCPKLKKASCSSQKSANPGTIGEYRNLLLEKSH